MYLFCGPIFLFSIVVTFHIVLVLCACACASLLSLSFTFLFPPHTQSYGCSVFFSSIVLLVLPRRLSHLLLWPVRNACKPLEQTLDTSSPYILYGRVCGQNSNHICFHRHKIIFDMLNHKMFFFVVCPWRIERCSERKKYGWNSEVEYVHHICLFMLFQFHPVEMLHKSHITLALLLVFGPVETNEF